MKALAFRYTICGLILENNKILDKFEDISHLESYLKQEKACTHLISKDPINLNHPNQTILVFLTIL